ncbi:unnamed protein product [Kuraishia capsulata CBS 1993]|uniref:Uncharacterized protein n=1 Tax=Kuraishia capsulata CBS 1993 TaxID=1382522 RepID=W6MIL5_9ASCO|nr:uncharacterized protein KUCA_T00000167001 [Kuraishia capsulata CBS 1993]CDK24207.1 unnamed protein product [Kuraishia capsulata CBS 1993]
MLRIRRPCVPRVIVSFGRRSFVGKELPSETSTAPTTPKTAMGIHLSVNRLVIPEIAAFDVRRTVVTDQGVLEAKMLPKKLSDDQIHDRNQTYINDIFNHLSNISTNAVDSRPEVTRSFFVASKPLRKDDISLSQAVVSSRDLNQLVIDLAHCDTPKTPISTSVLPYFFKLMMRTGNPTNFHSVKLFNSLIKYFLDLRELEYSLALFYKMKEGQHRPNTTTYNLFLHNLVTVETHGVNPLKTTRRMLRDMEANNIAADLVTWILVFRVLPDSISKQTLIQMVKDRNIPLDERFTQTILTGLEGQPGEKLVEFLDAYPELNSSNNLVQDYVISRYLVVNDDPRLAWEYLNSKDMRATTRTMNLFVQHSANVGAIANALGYMSLFNQEFGLKPDKQTFRILFSGVLKLGYYQHWRTMLRVIFNRADNVFGNAERLLSTQITKANARALRERKNPNLLDLDSKLSPDEFKLLKTLFLTEIKIDNDKQMKLLRGLFQSPKGRRPLNRKVDKSKSVEYLNQRRNDWLEKRVEFERYIKENGLAALVRRELAAQDFVQGQLLDQLTGGNQGDDSKHEPRETNN